MPIDWTDVDDALEVAGRKTDEALAGRVSSLTRLTDEEVKTLFPNAEDVTKLSELMQIVTAATTAQEKQNKLVANIRDLGGVVIKLLGKVV
jgi:hypothetical protein